MSREIVIVSALSLMFFVMCIGGEKDAEDAVYHPLTENTASPSGGTEKTGQATFFCAVNNGFRGRGDIWPGDIRQRISGGEKFSADFDQQGGCDHDYAVFVKGLQ